MATSTVSTGGLIDPTKQAEYPIILGDRLAGKGTASHSKLINIQYNYKTKSATARQRSSITQSLQSPDLYNLTITDQAPNAERNALRYTYKGSVDPDQVASDPEEQNLVLVFDSDRKAFVLEPVVTQLNFNLRSAPAKTEKQIIEQYAQLRILHGDEQGWGDDRALDSASGNDDGPADESNPYDFRHFLPKEDADDDKSASDNATPPYANASKANTPLMPAVAQPAPSPKSLPKTQANPPRQKKRQTAPSKEKNTPGSKTNLKPPAHIEKGRQPQEEEIALESSKPSPSDTGMGAVSSFKAAPSPGSNIIIDGDLIIDMGSPPPSRPAFKVNPAHFSSNNTPANEEEDDDDEEMEDFRLPSPVGYGGASSERTEPPSAGAAEEEEEDEDDALAAEMEAAFEEEARSQQYQPPSQQYNVPSEDESEVSEEE